MRKITAAAILGMSLLAQLPVHASDFGSLLDKASKLHEEKKKLKEVLNDPTSAKNAVVGGQSQESWLVPKLPGSELKAQRSIDLTRVVLPLSSNLRSDEGNYKQLKLTGEQSVYIYTVPPEVSKSYLKISTQIRQQLATLGFETLWQCDSADKNCGYFFPRRFIFRDRGEDSSKIFQQFDGLDNYVDGNDDYTIYTGRTHRNGQSYFITVVVGPTWNSKVIQYSYEIIKADDPLPPTPGGVPVTAQPAPVPVGVPGSSVGGVKGGLLNGLIAPFPGSQLKAENANDLTRVTIPLSSNQRNDEKNYKRYKLTGEQWVQIYSVPETVSKSYLKVYATIKQQLQAAGFTVLWQCDSADKNCGYFFPRQFIFSERGNDASDIYKKYSLSITNLYDGGSDDYAMITAKTKINGQSYFLFVLVGSDKTVEYSYELIKADEPTAVQ